MGPHIEKSVNNLNLPVGNWLSDCLQTKYITCGLMDEDNEPWDKADHQIVLSLWIAQFRG